MSWLSSQTATGFTAPTFELLPYVTLDMRYYPAHARIHIFGGVKSVNPLIGTLKPHSNTVIRFSAVHWLLMPLLHLVQRRWACAGGGATLSPILAVLNVIAHPSTASVPTLYCSMWHHNTFGLYRVNWESLSLCPSRGCGVVSPTKGIRRCRSGTC